jgi:aminopeptidase N
MRNRGESISTMTARYLEAEVPMSRTMALLLVVLSRLAQGAEPPVPTGRLPDTIKPTAYRLALTVDPSKPEFSGRTEIDAVLARPTRTFFLHGKDLKVSAARVTAGGGPAVSARYTEVDDSGVARIDLPADLPAGKVSLSFDYTAGFRTGAEGLFRAEVAGNWYVWTQLQAIDARRMFPGFDEPGFKTPFTVTVTAPTALRVFANAPEAGQTPSGAMTVHRFAATQPLPTYLIALGVGAFDVVDATVPANSVRKQPLQLRVIATKGQLPRMQIAAREAPKLLELLENYFRIPFPYEKLDLLATPILGGAMENAGLIIFDDTLLLLDADAPLNQLRNFGEIAGHELAHQWFGDLVTPTWWTDIWLNESFAEWMGKRVGDRWRPDLGMRAAQLRDAFEAMSTDSLGGGRPIRQQITENRQIASAFDSITYEKGAQVLSMFESYLGPEKFAQGIQLHLKRYAHGNANADDFFGSLAEAARDPKVVPAMRTFTDQTGVPVVTVGAASGTVTLAQARYRPLGVEPAAAQTWMIPLCLSRDTSRVCTVLESASASIPAPGGTSPLMPNAGGAGYYRFRLDAAGWDQLIAAASTLPALEALALADSLWADFAAGTGSFERVVAAARALSTNPERLAVLELGQRLKGIADTVLTAGQRPAYRKVMQSIYTPRLNALGIDVRPGAHATESPDRQFLRQSLVPLVALEGRDPQLRAKLAAAAAAYVGGDSRAIDPAFRGAALSVAVQERGVPFINELKGALVKSTDPLFRRQASLAIASADTSEQADAALRIALSPDIQSFDSLIIVLYLAAQPEARDAVIRFVEANFQPLMERFPGFARSQVVKFFDGFCTPEDIVKLEAYIRPKLAALGGGELELEQAKQRIGQCVALKKAKGAEIAAALAR